jgi:death-on-curing protein
MISLTDVQQIHDILIERFGGSKGIRDHGGLDAALNRPSQTFDGKDLYATPVDKAAAIFESVISNHPFIDGNKRTAYVLMRLVLKRNGMDIVNLTQDQKFEFVIRSAKGELSFEEIRNWIRTNSK